MSFAETPSGRVYVESHGHGPALLVVPSFGCTAKAYKGLVPYLSGTHRVILYDPTGMGRSDEHQGELTGPSIAHQIASILDHYEIEKASLLGASMGALIAQHFAFTHRQRLDRLIMVTPPMRMTAYGRTMNHMLEELLYKCDATTFVQYLVHLTLCPQFVNRHPSLVQQMAKRLEPTAQETETMKRQILGLRGSSAGHKLAEMDAPTLIIAGRRDVITPPEQAEAIHAELPNSQLLILDEVAHNPFIEATKRCFAAIAAFLAG